MKTLKRISLLLLVVFLLASCSLNQVNDPSKYGGAETWSEVFESYWNGMNNKYVFWDLEKSVDWDEVYRTYQPKFAALDDFNDAKQGKLACQYFFEMSNGLVDRHYIFTIQKSGVPGKSFQIIPNQIKVLKKYSGLEGQELFELLYNMQTGGTYDSSKIASFVMSDFILENYAQITMRLLNNYFKPGNTEGYEIAAEKHVVNAANGALIYEVLGGMIPEKEGDVITGGYLYVYTSKFALSSYLQELEENPDNEDAKGVVEAFKSILKIMVDRKYTFKNETSPVALKGIIFDFRGNGGGSVDDLSHFYSALIASDRTFAELRQKSGVNRLDYADWTPLTIKAGKNILGEYPTENFKGKIVVVTNSGSASMSEITTMLIKNLGGVQVGGVSMGAQGPSAGTDDDLYRLSGGFTLDTVFTVNTQGMVTRPLGSKKIYEAEGLPPEEVIPFKVDPFLSGRDMRLEAAIKYITTGTIPAE